ncbi:MAG: S9 family peptidase, partial [Bacteroidia bacterium]
MKTLRILPFLFLTCGIFAQSPLTIEMLWKMGRVSAVGITKDGQSLVYKVSRTDLASGKNRSELFQIALKGGDALQLDSVGDRVADRMISPDGKYKLGHQSVKLENVFGKDRYTDLPNTS